jgi:hypothetical protein
MGIFTKYIKSMEDLLRGLQDICYADSRSSNRCTR